jgi:hypothetical protein
VYPHGHLPDPVDLNVCPGRQLKTVGFLISTPQIAVSYRLLPAISPLEDGEMCGSAVFRDRVLGVAGLHKGIRGNAPKGPRRSRWDRAVGTWAAKWMRAE